MIDINAILNPFEGDNSVGENLRYSQTYDAITEARREDDVFDTASDAERKIADWSGVQALAVAALSEKSKDIQIAVWLMEALIHMEGFPGLNAGLETLIGLLENFWETVYPQIEDDDLDYRIGPLEFMNDKLSFAIRSVALTDPRATGGYSQIKYQEAQQVGASEELMAEGKLGIDQFETAVARSPKSFYKRLNQDIQTSMALFARLDDLLDERFGREAPRMAEFKEAIEMCQRFVSKTLRQKLEMEPDARGDEAGEAPDREDAQAPTVSMPSAALQAAGASPGQGQIVLGNISDTEAHETALWNSAVAAIENEGIKRALDILFVAACSAPSTRARTRYRLLMAKLCLQGNRPDLARPIAEELNTLIEELGLERWESPVWIAEVLGTLYRCLIQAEDDEDTYRAEEIFKKMCTIDLTKALAHRQ
jgi:type VI secretion system protein ImpA